MVQREALRYCKDKSIDLKGDLVFDPYCGWLDKSDKYKSDKTGAYCIICDLNIKEKFCDGGCGESCTIFT